MLRTNLSKYYQSDSIFHFYLTRCERVTANVMARI